MKSSLSALPFMAMALLLAALLLLDLAFDAAPEVLLAFVPALVWLGIIVVRGRG
jgi:hypothetical protein